MKRVLVTGGSGFIGRQVWEPLQRRGYEIHAVGRRTPDRLPPGVGFHEIDLLDCGTHQALMEIVHPTHLLHLAWYAEHGKFWNAPENLRWLEATQSLMRACALAGGRRMVAAGTCAEYDWSDGVLVEQQTPERPASLYGETKLKAFRECGEIVGEQGGSLAWGRIFSPYGPGEPPGRLVPHVITSLLRGEPARCSQGLQQRDFLYSPDVADALVALLDCPVSGAVNIGSGVPLRVGDLAMHIATMLGHPELLRLGEIAAQHDSAPMVVADVQRLAREVGWQPRFTLEQGLTGTIEWWRDRLAADNIVK